MKTLWFRYTYIALLIVSYKNPRVIPMLYSFYLIVYLICISYLILLFFLFNMYCFFVCRLYIGFSFIIVIMGIYVFLCLFLVIRIGIILSLTSLSLGLCVCFLGSMIISGILFIYYFYDDFYLSLALCDKDYHWLMIILFCLFICCFGLWVYNPCDMGIIELFIS